jgi:hypothetical protein
LYKKLKMPVSLEKLNNSLIKLNISKDIENKSLKRKSNEQESILVRDPSHPNGCVFKTLNQKKNENYEMELNIECEEDIEYLEFESLTMNSEEEKLDKELHKLVDRIFEVLSSWIDYYNRHKNLLVKKTIITYKSKYLSEFYKEMLVGKFHQILFEISYIKKPKDRRDNYLYVTSCLVVIKTINYVTNVFEMGFFKEDQYEEVGQKILECF